MIPFATLSYAFTLGLVAALNPCGFPLLPVYLALFVGENRDTDLADGAAARHWVNRTTRGLLAGTCVTLGFLVVFGVVGFIAGTGFTLIVRWAPSIMIVVGLVIVAIGITGVTGKTLRIPTPRIPFAAGRTAFAMVGFGIAYAVASLSCALPLFLAGVSAGFATHSALDGVAAFIAYAAGMGLFMIIASLVAAHLGARSIRFLRPLTRFVPRIASVVVVVVGLYVVLYWVVAATSPLSILPITRGVNTVQSALSGGLASIAGSAAIVLSSSLFAVLCLVTVASRRRSTARANPTGPIQERSTSAIQSSSRKDQLNDRQP
jgi:cytochrome c-type biogenesis protein